jgi:nucleoside-diphosphate-sugar epimerase
MPTGSRGPPLVTSNKVTRTVAITGAYGYLGSLIRRRLEAAGWQTIALVRAPKSGDRAVVWSLSDPSAEAVLKDACALVHCAYDFSLRRREDIWRINVDGTRRLLRSTVAAGKRRILVMSSMSAYAGTEQIYGQAKLAIERLTVDAGGIAVRPGLVYGDCAGGMAATLVRLTSLPFVPLISGGARQFPVHEADLGRAIVGILDSPGWTPEVFGIAQPDAVSFRTLLVALARKNGRTCRFLPVPWRAVYAGLRALEAARVPVPLRSDSLLGLVHPAPSVPVSDAFPDLLDTLHQLGQPAVNARVHDD